MITGHFSPAKRPIWLSNEFSFFFFFVFFRWLLPCQYFLGNWTLLLFSLLGVYIDQSSSSQIHPKCNVRQAKFTKHVKWGKIHQKCEVSQDWDFNQQTSIFKASLSRWVGVGNEGKFDIPYTFGTGVDIRNPESPGYSWQSARLTSGKFQFRKCQF